LSVLIACCSSATSCELPLVSILHGIRAKPGEILFESVACQKLILHGIRAKPGEILFESVACQKLGCCCASIKIRIKIKIKNREGETPVEPQGYKPRAFRTR